MNYVVAMGPSGVSSLIKIGSATQNLMEGGYTNGHIDSKVIS
jgi:hypothetical protein